MVITDGGAAPNSLPEFWSRNWMNLAPTGLLDFIPREQIPLLIKAHRLRIPQNLQL